MIPESAVQASERGFVTYVVDKDTARVRPVGLGLRTGTGFVEILSGLEAGEKIVVSGNFLLDSESRMRTAGGGVAPQAAPAAAAAGQALDPVCGMTVDEAQARAAGRTSEHGGKTWFFCAPGCKTAFDANPGSFLAKATWASSKKPSPSPASTHEAKQR